MMTDIITSQQDFITNGFTIIDHFFSNEEVQALVNTIEQADTSGPTFRRGTDLYRPENIDWSKETEVMCRVQKGGVMLMRPLLLHASNKTTNNKKRRVIHIEFSNKNLPEPLQWSELTPV